VKHQAIGIDIGTTGVKAALVEADGRILADAIVEHDLHSPHTGWAEENPEDWILGTVAALSQLSRSPEFDPMGIAAIGVSGMVPAMVLLDEHGQPVRPSIQQNDARSIAEVAELTDRIDQRLLYERALGAAP
jgi:xylulokinase